MEANSVNSNVKHQTENLSDNNGVEKVDVNSQEVNSDEIDELLGGDSDVSFENIPLELAHQVIEDEKKKK